MFWWVKKSLGTTNHLHSESKRPKQPTSSSKTFPLVRIILPIAKVQISQRCRNTCRQRCVRSGCWVHGEGLDFLVFRLGRGVCGCVNQSHLSRLFEKFNNFRAQKIIQVSLVGIIIFQVPPHQDSVQDEVYVRIRSTTGIDQSWSLLSVHPMFFFPIPLWEWQQGLQCLRNPSIKVHLYVMLTTQEGC